MYSHDRRDATATPLCGAHRGTRANPLLTKTQLGSVKATSYDLPADFQFTYGMQQVRSCGRHADSSEAANRVMPWRLRASSSPRST